MKRKRFGFTLIEVTLFMAITALIFIGIAAGTNNSIQRQRFYDSVQTFAEFMRSVYSEVANPQSLGDGRSDEALYGKLVTFGEVMEVSDDGVTTLRENNDVQRIYVYDVVGLTDKGGTGSAQDALISVKANVVHAVEYGPGGAPRKIMPVGVSQTFAPKWAMSVETTARATDAERATSDDILYKGSILIVRHPRSGTINTLVSPTVVKVNEFVQAQNMSGISLDPYGATNGTTYLYEALLMQYLKSGASEAVRFTNRQVDFCINQFGERVDSDYRWDVRLIDNARNASGVEVIGLDADEVINGEQVGNRCRF